MSRKSPYSPELRRRAVRMVGEVRPQYQTVVRPEIMEVVVQRP
ncbi:MAG: hypothetical protein JWL58_123 [Streptosporangiaceae bacterium]|jgi:hypothetical protein|nr:hypothetical protein [Streptosporangiaceae bacterium]